MKKIMYLMLIGLAAMFTACDGNSGDDDSAGDGDVDSGVKDSGTGDSDTDSDTDADSDTDTDADTDADSDTDTDTDVNDPTACDCLNGVSQEAGCVDISGDWYLQNYTHDTDSLLTVSLTIVGKMCKVDSTGPQKFFYSYTGIMLPLEFFSEEDNQHEQVYYTSDSILHVKQWGQSSNNDYPFTR